MSYPARRRSSSGALAPLLGLILILGFVAYLGVGCAAAVSTQTVTISAYAKERGADKRVYTTDGDGVYTVNDSLVQGKVASGTTFARLPIPFAGAGSPSQTVTLTCKVNGFRIPILSMFKNILECDPPPRSDHERHQARRRQALPA